MLERVSETIERHEMFARGDRVGVAVSGGADSVCLLHVLAELAPQWALKLSVVHVDHQLRGEESQGDAEFVHEMASRMGFPFHIRLLDVGRRSEETGENLEQAARLARREFFRDLLDDRTIDRVALGHTLSDQAETVLFRLLRGAGVTGLRGILPVTSEGLVRPLLAVKRSDVERYLREKDLAWREDSSNRDLRFARNRIRHGLLPDLSRDWNPALTESLGRMAELACEDDAFWRRETSRLATKCITEDPPAVLLRVADLNSLDRALARRLIRLAIERVKGNLREIAFLHVDDVLSLVGSTGGDGQVRLPGVDVSRSFGWIRLSPVTSKAPRQDFSLTVSPPGRFQLPDGGAIVLQILEKSGTLAADESSYNENGYLDWDRVQGPLELRYWKAGDRYRPGGHLREKRIKAFFQEARIPVWKRHSWPILTCRGTIVWARGLGAAAECVATPESRAVLLVRETADAEPSQNLTATL